MMTVRAARPDLHQHRCRLGPGVDQQSGDRHPRHVGDGDGGRSTFGQKGRETEAEDNRIGPHHAQWFAQAIHAGRQQQMAPGRERAVDGRDRRGRIGDQHGVQRHMASGRCPIPGHAARLTAERRDEDRPFAPRPDAQERLLAHHWHGRHRRIGWGREARRGRARDTHEHHVPVRSLPALHAAVAGEPLLLRTGADRPVHPAIRHEAAARPAAIVQGEVAGQMDAAIGCGLRHGPAIHIVGWPHRQIFDAAPEIDQRHALCPIRLGMHMASHGDVAWHEAQSRDLREEADVDVEAVIAGFEQDRAAPVGEMRALLFLEPAVDHRLCARLVCIDDQDVRPQVGIAASDDRRRVRKRTESDRRHACDQFPTCRIAHPALPYISVPHRQPCPLSLACAHLRRYVLVVLFVIDPSSQGLLPSTNTAPST